MFCQRCQHSLRSSESVKCGDCEARFHAACAADKQLELEGGDRRHAWRCAQCKQPASAAGLAFPSLTTLLQAVNNIAEKFELVNKIQLPKLNSELSQIKLVTDRIVKQNEQILNKLEGLKKGERLSVHRCQRRREVNVSPRVAEAAAAASGAGERPRYRTRRRAYPLHKMFVMLNRSLYTDRPKRKR